VHGGLLEIGRIGGKDLPAGDLFPKELDRSHAGEVVAKAVVIFESGGEPDAVVRSMSWSLAQDENDLVADVDRSAAEHGPRDGTEFGDRVEHEFVRNRFSPIDRERIVRRKRPRFLARVFGARRWHSGPILAGASNRQKREHKKGPATFGQPFRFDRVLRKDLERYVDRDVHSRMASIAEIVAIVHVIDVDVVGLIPVRRPGFRVGINNREPEAAVLEAGASVDDDHGRAINTEKVSPSEVLAEALLWNAIAHIASAVVP
jgi:hypothetical protein